MCSENTYICFCSSPKIKTLARHLAPAYGRFGGTPADFIIFKPHLSTGHAGTDGFQMFEMCTEYGCNSVPTSNYTLTGELRSI